MILMATVVVAQGDNPFEIAPQKQESPIIIDQPVPQREIIPQREITVAKDTLPPARAVEKKEVNIFDISPNQKPPVEEKSFSKKREDQIDKQPESENLFDISADEEANNEQKDEIIKPTVNDEVVNSAEKNFGFVLWITLLCLIIVAAVVNFYKNVIVKLTNSLTNENVLKLNMRNENAGFSPAYLMLYLVAILQISIFIYLINCHFLSNPCYDWIKILLFVVSIILIKHMLLYGIGSIFNLENITKEYSFTIVSYNIIFGLLLIPSNVIAIYAPDMIGTVLTYIMMAIGVLLLIFTYLRSFLSLGSLFSRNYFHFLLYLCTFEIVPLLIMMKLFIF